MGFEREMAGIEETHDGVRDIALERFGARRLEERIVLAHVEQELGIKPSDMCLIACHTWDTLGAVAAGWEAALIKRVGNDVLGVGPQPNIVGNSLDDVANQLIARHAAG
jgi:2-haloacid dehalogenase